MTANQWKEFRKIRTIKFRGLTYKLRYSARPNADCWGTFKPSKGELWFYTKECPPNMAARVVLHELFHVVANQNESVMSVMKGVSQLSIPDWAEVLEEWFVDTLSRGITEILVENPDLTSLLLKNLKQGEWSFKTTRTPPKTKKRK